MPENGCVSTMKCSYAMPRESLRCPGTQKGATLPVVILVLVLLAVLGTAMVQLNATGQRSIALEVVSSRAFYAAESGVQFGLGKIFPRDGTAGSCATWPLSYDQPGLRGCSASVQCTGPRTRQGVDYYTVVSHGQCGSGEIRARRTVEVGVQG